MPKVEINNIMLDRVHSRNNLRECEVPDQQLPTLFPHKNNVNPQIEGEHKQAFTRIKPFRNGTPKGSYRIAVARLTGLECTQLSTFPRGLGHQNVEKPFVHTPRLPLA
ncbi:hypothetical protein [Paraburkholderia hospita]|jgi:hypothetical protein|uniref:hypothetical protein n=1 Tax=Paraburkholderia hospita TaxID=169430 RepID=UPI0009A825C0|nr:hypothetical protein [Paraburkholderia hospita]